MDGAYKRHLATPHLQRSLVHVDRPEEVPHAELERRLRPLLIQALPEGIRRGLLSRGTVSCSEVLLEAMVDVARFVAKKRQCCARCPLNLHF